MRPEMAVARRRNRGKMEEKKREREKKMQNENSIVNYVNEILNQTNRNKRYKPNKRVAP